MKSSKNWTVTLIALFELLFVSTANARVTTFAWDAATSWPAGTTIELEANGAKATGITETQHTLDVQVQPGGVISARARAVPPAGYQCGDPLDDCQPSDWATLNKTLPANLTGLFASKKAINSMAAAIGSTSTVTNAQRTNTTITAPSGIANNDVLVALLLIGAASAPTVN